MHSWRLLISLLCGALCAPGLSSQTAAAPPARAPAVHFRELARPAGLTVSHISSAEQHYIIESMSGGVGVFDCDNDGKLDIVVGNGSPGDRFPKRGGGPIGTLYPQGA